MACPTVRTRCDVSCARHRTRNLKARQVYVDAVQWSAAAGDAGYGAGGGPTDKQCLAMGYPGRQDIVDSAGNRWRPGTEFIVRTGSMTDSVAATWWTSPAQLPVAATTDAELYRYGVHAREFCTNVTVGPGTYYVRLKFAANRRWDTCQNCVSIAINGQAMVSKLDVSATAGGTMKAVDLVFNDIQPRNGVIDIRFTGGDTSMSVAGEAFVQAIEVGPGPGGEGTAPVVVLGRNVLRNAGFERWTTEGGKAPVETWRHETDAGSNMALERVASPLDDLTGFERVAEGVCAARVHGAGAESTGAGCGRVSQQSVPRVSACLGSRAWQYAHVAVCRWVGRVGAGRDWTCRASHCPPQPGRIAGGRCVPLRFRAADDEAGNDTGALCAGHVAARRGRVRWDLLRSLRSRRSARARPHRRVGRGQCRESLARCAVAVGKQAVQTNADGMYSIGSLADLLQRDIQASKQGHLSASRVLQLEAGDNRCDLTLTSLSTHNLLVNGDFEAGFAAARSVEHGQAGVRDPWRFRFTPGINCYIYPESIYGWRKPRIRYGREAISQVTDGRGTMELYQDVVVDANQPLVASAWILALDVQGDGQGFGAGPQDFAGLVIQELDLKEGVLVSHERVGLTQSTQDFQLVRLPFTTSPDTVKVRVILTSTIDCIWQKGAAIFDECVLEPAAPGSDFCVPQSDHENYRENTRRSRSVDMKTGLGLRRCEARQGGCGIKFPPCRIAYALCSCFSACVWACASLWPAMPSQTCRRTWAARPPWWSSCVAEQRMTWRR